MVGNITINNSVSNKIEAYVNRFGKTKEEKDGIRGLFYSSDYNHDKDIQPTEVEITAGLLQKQLTWLTWLPVVGGIQGSASKEDIVDVWRQMKEVNINNLNEVIKELEDSIPDKGAIDINGNNSYEDCSQYERYFDLRKLAIATMVKLESEPVKNKELLAKLSGNQVYGIDENGFKKFYQVSFDLTPGTQKDAYNLAKFFEILRSHLNIEPGKSLKSYGGSKPEYAELVGYKLLSSLRQILYGKK
ncbi:MAG: hypothetical protein PHV30_02330 [Candidatus Margulisbacteria bacterium]|nr:hypothetical protein [Candidatus Margulisiibacteriota bacterium]